MIKNIKKKVSKSKPRIRRSAKGFKLKEYVVYPTHGVGQIIAISDQEISGTILTLFVLSFEKERMILRVPVAKATQVGLRKLVDEKILKSVMKTLRGRARIKRTMWSRRAQEYGAKINSGDIVAVAEVVRDLYRSETQADQSYSERQLYDSALERLTRELAVIKGRSDEETIEALEKIMGKSVKKSSKGQTSLEVDSDTERELSVL